MTLSEPTIQKGFKQLIGETFTQGRKTDTWPLCHHSSPSMPVVFAGCSQLFSLMSPELKQHSSQLSAFVQVRKPVFRICPGASFR